MNTNTKIPNEVREVGRTAENAATSKWVVWLARLGFVIKGVLYLTIGWLAANLAIGHGGATTDQRGAIQTIVQLPLGKVLLTIITVGLVGLGLWYFVLALFDPEGEGSNAKGIVTRISYAWIGVSYVALAFGAFQIETDSGNSRESTTATTQGWTALLLKQPLGVALVVLVGLVVIGVAFYLFYTAYSASFQTGLNLTGVSAQLKKVLIFLGRFGYASLGVVFSIIGLFMIIAALKHNPGEAKGLDSALQELVRQPFGPILLGVVALGFIAYGLYSLVEARYRRVGKG